MNNTVINFSLLILFSVVMNIGRTQITLEKELDSSSNSIKKRIVRFLEADVQNVRYLMKIKTGNYVCIPFCEFDGARIFEKKNEFDLIKIRTDTSHFSYRSFFINDSLFVFPDNLPSGELIRKGLYDSNEFITTLFYLMSRYALQTSTYCFALRIRATLGDSRAFPIICYIKKNKLQVLGFDGWDANQKIRIKNYDGIGSYINDKYGSLSRYVSSIVKDSLERAEYIVSVLIPIQTLKKSYYFNEKFHQVDTLLALNLFLNEADSMVKLTTDQAATLKTDILAKMSFCPRSDGSDIVEFQGKDITTIVSSILSYEQKLEYKKAYLIKRANERQLFNKLLHAYEYWDIEIDRKGAPEIGTGQYDSRNPMHARALSFIFSGRGLLE